MLTDYLKSLICTYCAGVGKVTTQVTKTFQGRPFKEVASRENCPHCGGTGKEPGRT